MTAPEGISLEEAIKILPNCCCGYKECGDDKALEAMGLGIEALKRIDNVRNVGNELPGALLPGEKKS